MRLVATACIVLIVLTVTTPLLAFSMPAKATAKYEVLEPETWVGKELPILPYIDIGEQLKHSNWLVVLYHYDCPDCAKAIPIYEQMARDLRGNEDFLRIALIEVPPYGQGLVSQDSPCILGKMVESKEWFVTTPVVVILANGSILKVWQQTSPDLKTILSTVVSRAQ